MYDEQDNAIRYKWNPDTGTGFRLRYDARRGNTGYHGCFHVEDWANHLVVGEWGCDSLDEALGVLKDFFDIDVGQERHRLQVRWAQ
jgi:hypothetical protein